MASRQWFIGRGGKQEGPYPDERLRELIAGGSVTAETLVWTQGMNAWAKASEVPGLMFGAPRPPAMPAGSTPAVAYATDATGPLSTHVRVWPLFGRAIVVAIAQLTVIPAPWVLPWFYRWFVDQIDFPGQQRVTFEGKPGDIWYIFVLNALLGYAGYDPWRPAHPGHTADRSLPRHHPALVFAQPGLGRPKHPARLHRKLLADARMVRAADRLLHLHHRLGLGRHRMDALDVQEHLRLRAATDLYRQRRRLSLARARPRGDVDLPHPDPVDDVLVHPLADLAIRAG